MTALRIELPGELVEEIARRAAAIVVEQLAADASGRSEFLTVAEAAEVLRCSRQRVYDLLSARRLPKYRDGARVLVRRADLDEHVGNGSGRVAPRLPQPSRGRMNTGGAA